MAARRAFALIELFVVAALVVMLLAVCLPTIQEHRRQASMKADLNSMRLIGQASAMYSGANAGRLFTFSWKPGQMPASPNGQLALSCALLNPGNTSGAIRAAGLQHLDIVTHSVKDVRLPPFPSTVATGYDPFVLYSHFALTHFMGWALPTDVFISRGDKHRTYWKNNLDEYLDDPRGSPARPPSNQTAFNQLWRWAFSSSYQVGPSHWSADFAPPQTAARGPSNTREVADPSVTGNRTVDEVAFPSMKVMMFDEYDRYNAAGRRYFALETSSSIMNFYDGHAARLATADANFGFDPNNPDFGADTPDEPSFGYFYSPISGWDPPGAQRTYVPAYYDQTRNGLQGVDYPTK